MNIKVATIVCLVALTACEDSKKPASTTVVEAAPTASVATAEVSDASVATSASAVAPEATVAPAAVSAVAVPAKK